MLKWCKKYWIEILVFVAIAVYYVVGVAPTMTFMSLAGDGYDYVVGATNMWSVRPTGYPTYIMIGWLFERLPGDPFWNLGLLSALCAWLTCIFIYLSIKHFTPSRIAAFADLRRHSCVRHLDLGRAGSRRLGADERRTCWCLGAAHDARHSRHRRRVGRPFSNIRDLRFRPLRTTIVRGGQFVL